MSGSREKEECNQVTKLELQTRGGQETSSNLFILKSMANLPRCPNRQMPSGTINLPTIHLDRRFQAQSDNRHLLLQLDAGSNERVVDLDLMFGRPCDNHFTRFRPDSLQESR